MITQTRCIVSVSNVSIGIGVHGRSTARKCSSDERASGKPNSMHIPNHRLPTSFLHLSSNTNGLTPSLSIPLSNVPLPNHHPNHAPTLSDLIVTQRYRTRPFWPDPQIYELVIHDESNVVFGIDLRKWSKSRYALAHSEERSSYHVELCLSCGCWLNPPLEVYDTKTAGRDWFLRFLESQILLNSI